MSDQHATNSSPAAGTEKPPLPDGRGSEKRGSGGRIRRVLLAAGRRSGVILLLVAAFGIGYLFRGGGTHSHMETEFVPATPATEDDIAFWTCAMHPQIKQPGPGDCPICGMDLIPVHTSDAAGGELPVSLTTSEASRALMDIQTAPVERRFVTAEIRMVGKIDYDETKLAYITAWVPGRIDQMYVDYTGVTVKKGDHMVYLYSPELLTAEEELLRTARAVRTMRADSPETLRRTAQSTLEAARRKLELWGLMPEQVRDVEERGVVSDHVTIYAPAGGTVVERIGREGMYVETGTRIYAIAGLDELWVLLEAYESDLAWLHYGQEVAFTTEAYPGEEFVGQVAFIDPVINPETRTAKVRVNVRNPEGRLKPEMFVRATVRAQVATQGRVMNPDLAGKWISPMHPHIVKDGPGQCDICGMTLVKAETLGYVPLNADESAKPLAVPAAAPLITGKRAVVYVEVPGTEAPTYVGREVTLGPRAGEYYIIESGLAEGERVVVNGNFMIDSALQIQAKTSMMNPPTDASSDAGSGAKSVTPVPQTGHAGHGMQ